MIMAGACGSRGKTVELSCVERVRAFALGRPRASQWSDGREQGEVESRLTLHSTAFYLSRASLLYNVNVIHTLRRCHHCGIDWRSDA